MIVYVSEKITSDLCALLSLVSSPESCSPPSLRISKRAHVFFRSIETKASHLNHLKLFECLSQLLTSSLLGLRDGGPGCEAWPRQVFM